MSLHWFPFFPGDFISGTIRLSFHERGTYSLMLVAYYANGGPFPLDQTELYRMVGCESDSDRRAVDRVLQRKFIVTDEGYAHERCEKVIAEQQAAHHKRVEAAKKRWSNVHAMHEQSMSNQNQNQKGSSSKRGGSSKVTTQSNIVALSRDAEIRILEALNTRTKKAFRPVDAHLDLIRSRMKEGATEADCLAVIEHQAKEWLYDDDMRKYLRPETLFNRTKFAQYLGEIPNERTENAPVR